ncbi:MAG: hypothetical protein RIT45_4349 [Pseudomonadota bacterium]|jgi:predicted DNA-binding transcriptional regulator YafY
MLDTIHRQWQMLRYLPRHPRRIGTSELLKKLSGDGYDVSARTIQRDLQSLALIFPIVSDERRPRGWSFAPDAKASEIPSLSTHEAIALRLAETHLEPMLPPASREQLVGHFAAAREVLAETRLGRWAERVAVAPGGMHTLAPKLDGAVLEQVLEGLMHQRVIAARYRRRGDREARAYRLHPVGLVYRDGVGYLLAMNDNYEDVLQFPLHRFVAALSEATPARDKADFDAQRYAFSEAMGYLLSDAPIALRLHVDAHAGARLRETPLAEDQTVEEQPDGTLLIRATVADTRALRSFVLGFGPLCEVLAPASLRAEVAAAHRSAAARYDVTRAD